MRGGRGRPRESPPQANECWHCLFFLDLIYHIITPRKKKTSISRRNGDVSMENLGILVHNRSGVKKIKEIKGRAPRSIDASVN